MANEDDVQVIDVKLSKQEVEALIDICDFAAYAAYLFSTTQNKIGRPLSLLNLTTLLKRSKMLQKYLANYVDMGESPSPEIH